MLLIGLFALLILFAPNIFASPLFNIYLYLSEKVFGDFNANKFLYRISYRIENDGVCFINKFHQIININKYQIIIRKCSRYMADSQNIYGTHTYTASEKILF